MWGWFTDLQPAVQAAIISSIVALLSALAVEFFNPFAQRHLEQFKSSLKREESSEDARRQYEYEARKRLYTHFEPLLFQLFEVAEGAYWRVVNLVLLYRLGRLDGRQGTELRQHYYLYSTIYYLFLPAAVFRVMSRTINFVDLTLDPNIRIQYSLAKAYTWAFTEDYRFATLEPILPFEYSPHHADTGAEFNEAAHRKQGLNVGAVQNFVDALIITEGDRQRIISFAEFERLLQSDDLLGNLVAGSEQELPSWLNPVLYLFYDFDFPRRPVLARMIITQALISRMILYSGVHSCTIRGLNQALDAFCTTEDAKALLWDGSSLELFRPAVYYIKTQLNRFSSDYYDIKPRRRFAWWKTGR
jgi:hypothetical protein